MQSISATSDATQPSCLTYSEQPKETAERLGERKGKPPISKASAQCFAAAFLMHEYAGLHIKGAKQQNIMQPHKKSISTR